MKITAGILFYLMNRYNNMQHICHGADRMPLRRSEHFRSQPETENGVLYIYADKNGVLLFCAEKRQKTSQILIKALKEGSGAFSSFWIPYENLDAEQKKNLHLADEVSEFISQIWNYFAQVQNEILEAILSQRPVEEIMEKVRNLIRKPFVIVDRDMLLLYEHPDIPRLMTETMGKGYQEEIVEELLMAKEFHEVAMKREPFYYFMDSFSQGSYCINIVVEGYYYARLVIYVDEGEKVLPSGAEQITEYVATVIEQMIRSGVLKLHRSQNDQLHLICQRLLDGERLSAPEIEAAFESYYWDREDLLQVIYLEPHQATGWETQIENTMPTITRKLEQSRRHSCAVFSGKKILWLINETMSAETKTAHEMTQDLMVFLRENVFRAGAGTAFRNCRLLPSALKEAEAALVLGSQKDSSYWYYRFDDYRLEYMLKAIRDLDIAPLLLVHPAIPLLLEHDRLHESELSKTLQALIEKRGNVTQAADALFIHRTTLFRRLNQIKELTGIDPDDPDTALVLQLSYRIMEEN